MTSLEMALILSGGKPDTESAEALDQQLRSLDRYSPVYEAVARETLEGLTQAFWHQQQALDGLSAQERQALVAADPTQPLPPELEEVLTRIDREDVMSALDALTRTSSRVLGLLDDSPDAPPSTIQDALSEAFSVQAPPSSRPMPAPAAPAEVADLVATVAAPDASIEERAALARSLGGTPPAALDALAEVLRALIPLSHGAPADPDAAMVELGAAVDRAAPVLRLWGAAQSAQAVVAPESQPFQLPDPDGALPPLRLALPASPSLLASHASAPSMEDALRDVATWLGDEATARDAASIAGQIDATLSAEERDAVASTLDALHQYAAAQQTAQRTPLPAGVDAARLEGWVQAFLNGDLPTPGTGDAQALLDSMPFLTAQQNVTLALENVLSTAEELVGSFTSPQTTSQQSSPASTEEIPCELEPCDQMPADPVPPREETAVCQDPQTADPIVVTFLLVIDHCGTASSWDRDVLLSIDTGGDDTYTQRVGAPFSPDGGATVVPFNLLFDLGGSDTYDSGGQACSQGAACGSYAVMAADATNITDTVALSVLVDWDGDGVDARNVFRAGNESQGYGAPHRQFQTVTDPSLALGQDRSPRYHASPIGLLVERVGRDAQLDSTFEAGNHSQGATAPHSLPSPFTNGNDPSYVERGGSGMLVRLVGEGGHAEAEFQAAGQSQGVAAPGPTFTGASVFDYPFSAGGMQPRGWFVNAAGVGAVSDDDYRAGSYSQAAILPIGVRQQPSTGAYRLGSGSTAVFVDVVGPGGRSHDAYEATGPARGYASTQSTFIEGSGFTSGVRYNTPDAASYALFMDAAVAVPEAPAWGDADASGPSATVAPALDAQASSNDAYSGTILPGAGYGSDGGLFVDLEGTDVYRLEPAVDPTAEAWDDRGQDNVPRNDGTWNHRPATDCFLVPVGDVDQVSRRAGAATLGSGGGGWPNIYTPQINFTPPLVPCGYDLSNREDGDMVPAFVENLWPFWNPDPDTDTSSPLPTAVRFAVNPRESLNRPHAFVLSDAGQNHYGSDFSAALHIDLGGNDVYEGRVGAAQPPNGGAYLNSAYDVYIEGGSRDAGVSDVSVDSRNVSIYPGRAHFHSSQEERPISQHLLSFHLDLDGDDEYLGGHNRNQGFGGNGSVGILFDLGGSDLYSAGSWAQGAGVSTGIGVLLDVTTDPTRLDADSNRFRSVPPSRGVGHDHGLGVLIALGGHNSFRDGNDTTGHSTEGGITVNGGSNAAPRIHDETLRILDAGGTEVEGLLDVGSPYTFSVNVSDPDDDDLDVCWVFEHSEGGGEEPRCRTLLFEGQGMRDAAVDFVWNRTFQAATDGQAQPPLRPDGVTYDVRLEVMDTGGRMPNDGPLITNVTVRNEPPRLMGDVQGAQRVIVGQSAAYQAPFAPAADLLDPVTRVTWGDGRPDTIVQGDGINWALSHWGGSVRVPDAVPVNGVPKAIDVLPPNLLLFNDGDNSTGHSMQFRADSDPPFHFFVDLSGPHNIGRIELNATAAGGAFLMSVEGLLPGGRTHPLGTLPVDESGVPDPLTLPERPVFNGILLRQLQNDDSHNAFLTIREINVLGPGATHPWNQVGEFTMQYTVIDEYGGRNTTTRNVTVLPDAQPPEDLSDDQIAQGLLNGIPLTLADVHGRGAVRHATVPYVPPATDQAVVVHEEPDLILNGLDDVRIDQEDPRNTTITLVSATDAGSPVCIDWDDGSDPDCKNAPPAGDRFWFAHRWDGPDDHLVTLTYHESEDVQRTDDLVWLHVEEAFELRTESGEPLVFLALDSSDERTTWYTNFTDFLAVVDAGGDDRYIDGVAVPRSASTSNPATTGYLPALLIDRAGDDDHFSRVPFTQGAGLFGGVGLLVDAAGDDWYSTTSMGQGFGYKQGIGVLIDLGGDDAWNPIRSDPTDPVWRYAFPETWNTWTQRHQALADVRRSPLAPSTADWVQGASLDGVGVLLTDGGHDTFWANDRSQGHGGHDPAVQGALEYAVPDPYCNPASTPTNPNAVLTGFTVEALCILGITQVGLFNQNVNLGSPTTVPFPRYQQQGLDQFTGPGGPRYGPSVGLLVNLGGSAAYHGSEWVQGSASPSARGGLVDLDGGFVASSSMRGQAYTHDGHGVLAAGGSHAATVVSHGHAYTEPVPADESPEGVRHPQTDPTAAGEAAGHGTKSPMSIYLGPQRDRACKVQCGTAVEPGSVDPTTVAEERSLSLLVDPTPSRWDPPQLDWPPDDGSYHTDAWFNQTLSVEPSGSPPVLTPLFNVVVVTQPYPERDAITGECVGEPLGPPIRVLLDPATPGGSMAVDLDLGTELADGPLYPAGCHRLRALARHVDDGTGAVQSAEWAMDGSDSWLLPPPRVDAVSARGDATGRPSFLSNGSAVTVPVEVREPLAAQPGAPFDAIVELRLRNEAGALVPSTHFNVTQQQRSGLSAPFVGERIPFLVDPPQVSGRYLVEARAEWNDTGSVSEWQTIASLQVDKIPPVVSVQALETITWRGDATIQVQGTVEDASEPASLGLRLRRADCTGPGDCVLDLYPPAHVVDQTCMDGRSLMDPDDDLAWFQCVLTPIERSEPVPGFPCFQAGTCQVYQDGRPSIPVWNLEVDQITPAWTSRSAGGAWNWSAHVLTTGAFEGGRVVLQALATDLGGKSSGWVDLAIPGAPGGFLIDKQAPLVGVQGVRSLEGTTATNQSFADGVVSFMVEAEECAANRFSTPGNECIDGSGIAQMTTLIRNVATGEMNPLDPLWIGETGSNAEARFDWAGDASQEAPDPGRYEVIVQAQDGAGNVLVVNPGIDFFIDRGDPFISSVSASPPGDRSAIKPGDWLEVEVDAVDLGQDRTGIHNVEARLATENATLDPSPGSNLYNGLLKVPDGLLQGREDTGIHVGVAATAVDEAGNRYHATSEPLVYYQDPTPVLDFSHAMRSDSLRVGWRTERDVQVTVAHVVDTVAGTQTQGLVESDGSTHAIRFEGLTDDRVYQVQVIMEDAAGHIQDLQDQIPTVETPKRADTFIVMDNLPGRTFSRELALRGHITNPVAGRLALHATTADGEPIEVASRDLEIPAPGQGSVPFEFTMDSEATLEASTRHAVDTVLTVSLDDGASLFSGSIPVRFDNAPPTSEPLLLGPAARNGWHNGTVLVDAGAADDTAPITYEVRVNEGDWKKFKSVRLDSDGDHTVEFRLGDIAFPPNVATLPPVEVSIDRTVPSLNVTIPLPNAATNQSVVPIQIEALDDSPAGVRPSGVEAVRVRIGQTWGSWVESPPDQIVLPAGPDGEVWVDVEARDHAGNMERRSLNVMRDRMPPSILLVRWLGLDANNTPLLHIVSEDHIGGVGRAAGVDSLRIGHIHEGEVSWGPWQQAFGDDVFPIPNSTGTALMVQLRDRAGNTGPQHGLPDFTETDPYTGDPDTDTQGLFLDLLRMHTYAPERGTTSTLFAFSVVAAPVEGQGPEAVWLEIRGQQHPMTSVGGFLKDGSRLHTVSMQLLPSRLDSPLTYRVLAEYANTTVESSTLAGPLVLEAGVGDSAPPSSSGGREIPVPSFLPISFLLGAVAVTARRFPSIVHRRRP